jgi:N-methylhydantoinase B
MSTDVKADVAGTGSTTPAVDPRVWDGKRHSYRPGPDWLSRVSPRVRLHQEVQEELDPVTFEVIRSRLWTTNLAAGETLVRISGSPVFQALDFNMCILTEDAEMVSNGPFIIYLAMGAPLAIPYIMEHFGDEPGINEGDVFLVSDPWVGASHQMDVLVAAPVFVDGKLFAWVSNAGHQYDLGGIVPGGWPQNAPDIFHDPIVFSPFKIVERGVLRRDLEEMYRRQSRMPELVALDLRAQIAGLHYAATEMLAMCGQFGAPTVKAAMRKILDDSQQSFADKLTRIPDGTWSETRFIDEKMPGDRDSYRVQVSVTKRGDRLIIDNKGTDEQQEGPIGITFVSFSGAVLGSLGVTMLAEHLFAVGGASRQIDYELVPGTLTIVDHPAPVAGGVMTIVNLINSLMSIISRMLACDPELKHDIIGTQTEFPLLVLAGVNDRGDQIGTGLFEASAQGSGGKPDRDGVDTTGMAWSPLMRLLNMESVEGTFPLVYLYRRERRDGGGAGRFRGGTGMDFAFAPYRAKAIAAITNVGGQAISTHGVKGLFGGYPVPTTSHLVRKGTNLAEFFEGRQIPADVHDLSADEDLLLRGKSNGTPLATGDVVLGSFGGGGGYGDPVERDPAAAQQDLALGYTSAGTLRDVCGIAVDDAGTIDAERTAELRASLLAERGKWPPASTLPGVAGEEPSSAATGEPPLAVHEYIVARDQDDARVLACSKCGTRLADYRGNYKHGMLVHEGPVTLIPDVEDPKVFIDAEMVFRRFCCPGCHVLAATEIARAGDPVQAELILA